MRKLFNPEIFLDIAIGIKDSYHLNEQGILRTAIGRAYYAAFLMTREYLTEFKGMRFEKERQHQDVIDALDALNENFIKNQLETLRDSRIKADYKLNLLINKDLCINSIILSGDIINSIEGI